MEMKKISLDQLLTEQEIAEYELLKKVKIKTPNELKRFDNLVNRIKARHRRLTKSMSMQQ